jgi:hypothetical protein
MTANIIAGVVYVERCDTKLLETRCFPFSAIAATANEHREPDTFVASFIVIGAG